MDAEKNIGGGSSSAPRQYFEALPWAFQKEVYKRVLRRYLARCQNLDAAKDRTQSALAATIRAKTPLHLAPDLPFHGDASQFYAWCDEVVNHLVTFATGSLAERIAVREAGRGERGVNIPRKAKAALLPTRDGDSAARFPRANTTNSASDLGPDAKQNGVTLLVQQPVDDGLAIPDALDADRRRLDEERHYLRHLLEGIKSDVSNTWPTDPSKLTIFDALLHLAYIDGDGPQARSEDETADRLFIGHNGDGLNHGLILRTLVNSFPTHPWQIADIQNFVAWLRKRLRNNLDVRSAIGLHWANPNQLSGPTRTDL